MVGASPPPQHAPIRHNPPIRRCDNQEGNTMTPSIEWSAADDDDSDRWTRYQAHTGLAPDDGLVWRDRGTIIAQQQTRIAELEAGADHEPVPENAWPSAGQLWARLLGENAEGRLRCLDLLIEGASTGHFLRMRNDAARVSALEADRRDHALANGGCVPKPAYDDLAQALRAAEAERDAARVEADTLRAQVEGVEAALTEGMTVSLPLAHWACETNGESYAKVNPEWLLEIITEAREVRAALAASPVPAAGRPTDGEDTTSAPRCPGCGSSSCAWKRLECASPVASAEDQDRGA